MTHGSTLTNRDRFTAARPRLVRLTATLVLALVGVTGVRAEPAESPRMQRAKDHIADEQWTRAIDELRAAVGDPKEANKDEALFWLAHSQNQAGDSAAALESVQRLEREHVKSRWVRPAHYLRLEIAQRLRRRDVMWWTAVARPTRPPAPEAVQPTPPEGRDAKRRAPKPVRPIPATTPP